MITYRRNTAVDYAAMKRLVSICFGTRQEFENSFEDGLYILAEEEGEIIGMTGIKEQSCRLKGAEVMWTGVRPDYRCKGLITQLLRTEVERLSPSRDIFCLCWRINDDKINLHHAMSVLGFEEITKGYEVCWSDYASLCANDCVMYKSGCRCWNDLYLRKGVVQ